MAKKKFLQEKHLYLCEGHCIIVLLGLQVMFFRKDNKNEA